ncbi:MAG: hypothetical protein QOE68_4174, partial [Thermoanaerobaculia bacterium]|nr:hypothetical protein [Thermoanaerobaculia bacterium]
PKLFGISSENAAHRIAVTWGDREGVYIPRRDSGSLVNQIAGGRLFPGEHHRAHFRVVESNDRVELHMKSADGVVEIDVAGTVTDALPASSRFDSVAQASAFFEPGSLGYSATAGGTHLDGIILKTLNWSVEPLSVEYVSSTFFTDTSSFPAGSVEFDCALLMRNIEHEWHAASEMYVDKKPYVPVDQA